MKFSLYIFFGFQVFLSKPSLSENDSIDIRYAVAELDNDSIRF